jgi:hypothetical protein
MIAYTEQEAFELIKQNKERLIGKPMFPDTTDERQKNVFITELTKEEVLPKIFRVVCISGGTSYQQELNAMLYVNGMIGDLQEA